MTASIAAAESPVSEAADLAENKPQADEPHSVNSMTLLLLNEVRNELADLRRELPTTHNFSKPSCGCCGKFLFVNVRSIRNGIGQVMARNLLRELGHIKPDEPKIYE